MEDSPDNQNRNEYSSWSEEEDMQLDKLYNFDILDILEISKINNRLPGDIISRLVKNNHIVNRISARGYLQYKQSDAYKKIVLENKKLKKERKEKEKNNKKDLNYQELKNEILEMKSDINSQNYDDTKYLDNSGKKWEETEETQLLDELNKNIPISEIAILHNRTPGGIISRIRLLAYNMHIKNIPMEEIIEKTKLNNEQINDAIQKREKQSIKKESILKEKHTEKSKENKVISIKYSNYEELNSDIREMKSEIKNLKSTIQELVEMMKAVYEFEDG